MIIENNYLNERNNKANYISKNKENIIYLKIILLLLVLNIFLLIVILSKYSKKYEIFDKISLEFDKIFQILNKKDIGELEGTNFEKITLLKYMTNNNILKYQGAQNCLLNDPDKQFCIYHLLSPKMIVGRKRVLIGEKRDGCYVMLDDFDKIKIAYSFGISKMIQFDYELAKKGIDVYMYDHTISSLPYNHKKFHWEKVGICGKNTINKDLKTLEELIMKNNHIHEKNMILKMDVEHWEWESLKDLPDSILKQFK